MTIRYDITHTTLYRYSKPVSFGEHRVMFRPRDSHDLRVLATDLQVSRGRAVRMIQDPHSNSVALVQPLRSRPPSCDRLLLRASNTHPMTAPSGGVAQRAEFYPFAYTVADRFDLEHYLRPLHDDPDGGPTAWARQFIRTDGPTGTRDLLLQMNQFIRDTFRLCRARRGRHPAAVADLAAGHRQLPRLCAADDGSRASPRHGGAFRLRLSL